MRAYFADEPGHAELRAQLLEGDREVTTSCVSALEFASAVARANLAGRAEAAVLAQFDSDSAAGGPIALVDFDAATITPQARDLILRQGLRTMDAVQVATALLQAADSEEAVVFVTRDATQAAGARSAGLEVDDG